MRIPPSLIVMSIATAVPFGLAIRDTVKGKGHRPTAEERAEAEQRAERAEYEARQAAEEALAAKTHERLVAELPKLFGPTPASTGTLLAHVKLGEPVPDATWPDGITVYDATEGDGTPTGGVVVHVGEYDQAACDELRAKLVAAWGPPTESTWLAADRSMRAHLDDCDLVFEPALDPASWLAAVDVIGKPESVLETIPTAYVDDGGPHWFVPGMGYGTGHCEVTAVPAKGKIPYLEVFGDTDFDTVIALRDVISARVKGQPTVDEDTGDWVWNKAPTARLHRDPESNVFTLALGKEPPL
jgi:hypothetical protein